MNTRFNLSSLAAVMAASAVTILSACGSKGDASAAAGAAPALAVETITPGSIELETVFPSTIKGKTDIEVRPMVSGNITAVHVDEGQRVHKGQALFTIDQVPYQAAVDQAQASVNVASTAVQTAQISYDSNKALFDKNIISAHALQISANQLAQAKAQLAQAQAGLVNAQKNLSYTQVIAPSDGIVGTIPLRVGALASPSGLALTTVSDNSQVYAYFSLNEKQILDLTDGGASTLEAAIAAMPEVKLRLANGTVFPNPGKVATVSGVIDASTGSATVRALFSNNNNMLRSGSTGSVIMPMNQTDVIIVPQKATFEVQDRKFVYTVDADNVLHSTPIEVLGIQDGRNYVVTSGLNQGDRIVVEGVGVKARDGITITPVDAAAQQQNKQ
ncbi:multidrug resistance protein MdtE [Muribaculaceae bacterium]|jgi:membrane fusion protein (multidrug efflux system)|nr:efflux RND transporter periplasmic adaptor subunit [Muribaculaceae bacterium]GFI06162.1 multidrug resistance protein MdtE [Muribaculaceae bacterium]